MGTDAKSFSFKTQVNDYIAQKSAFCRYLVINEGLLPKESEQQEKWLNNSFMRLKLNAQASDMFGSKIIKDHGIHATLAEAERLEKVAADEAHKKLKDEQLELQKRRQKKKPKKRKKKQKKKQKRKQKKKQKRKQNKKQKKKPKKKKKGCSRNC